MFFMGGMTLGYLQPPARTRRVDATAPSSDTEFAIVTGQKAVPDVADGAIERTLLWARRIIC